MLRVRRERERAQDELPGAPGRREPPRAGLGAPRRLRRGRVLVPPRQPLGPREIADEPVERGDVALPAPPHARLAKRAGDRSDVGRFAASAGKAAQRQGP